MWQAGSVFEWPASVFKRCPFWGLLTGFGVRGPTQPIAPYRAINYSAEVSL
jgi:hypothetical protein